jgi:hypothetical protein
MFENRKSNAHFNPKLLNLKSLLMFLEHCQAEVVKNFPKISKRN